MKHTFRILSLFFVLPLLSISQNQPEVKDGQPWTLQQCIDYAIKNNIQLKQSIISNEISKVNLRESYGNALPDINGFASHTYNFGQTIDPFTNQFANSQVLSQSLGLSTSVPIFAGLTNYNLIKQNQLNVMSGKLDVDKARNDLSLNIATAYLQILLSQEMLDNSIAQAELTKKQVQRMQILVDAGTVAKGNVLDVQAQLSSEELMITNAQNQLDMAYLTLVQLLEVPSTDNFKIVKPELNLPEQASITTTPGQIYNQAVSILPEIKSAELKIRSAEKGVLIAKGRVLPSLSVSGSYGTGYSGLSQKLLGVNFAGYFPNGSITSGGDTVYAPVFKQVTEKKSFADQYSDNINKTLGFRLTVPLFNGFANHSAISRAKLQLQNAELTLDLNKRQVQKTITQAYADASAALKRYNSSQKSVEAMEEAFKYAEQKFNLGAVNSIDYNNSKTRLAKAKSDLLQAKFEYIFKSKVLDFYMGKPLTL